MRKRENVEENGVLDVVRDPKYIADYEYPFVPMNYNNLIWQFLFIILFSVLYTGSCDEMQ